ncbi:MAG TPA: HlyD family efflux transporter periplasmic adaptor subunit [Woeseiaceae bacterium]
MPRSETENLFRLEALRSFASRSLGRPIAFMPRVWRWGVWLCLCLLIGIVFYLQSAEYARKARVRGWLVPRDGVVHIRHDRQGLVTQIHVASGDSVRQGDMLLRVASDRTLEDGSSFAERVGAGLNAELSEVTAREELVRQTAAIEIRAFKEQLASTNAELESLFAERVILLRRIGLAEDRVARLDAGRRSGAVAVSEFMSARDGLAELQQSAERLRQRIATLQRGRDELVAVNGVTSLDRAQGMSALNRERSRLEQDAARNEADRVTILTAPVDGVVATLDVNPGARFAPGQLLLSILPPGNSLIAEVYVPSRAMGQVALGQAASLSFDAFPSQHFGVARGYVDSIAGFVLLPGDIPAAFVVGEPVYKVRILLAHSNGSRTDELPLRAGMLLNADIMLERRTLMQWLVGLLRQPVLT